MPTTPRPIKVAGTTQYQSEVAAGVLDIIDAELDADFDTLYNLVNGKLDNANLAANAAIAYAKLALSGSIQASDLAPGIVLPIADGTITTADLADGAVTTPKLADGAVNQAKLLTGAASWAVAQQHRTDTLIHNSVNDEQLYLELPWTSRSGLCVVLAALHVVFGYDTGTPPPGYALNLRLDGTAGAIDGAVLAQQWVREPTTAVGVVVSPATLSMAYLGFQPAGAHRLKISGIPLNRFVSAAHINSGYALLVEFA